MADREKFEAWEETRNFDVQRMSPGSHDDYASLATEFAWWSWQASRRAALEEAALLCDEIAARYPLSAAGLCGNSIRALANGDANG